VALDAPPRILFKTGTHPDTASFPEGFAALSPDAADRLVAGGARLVAMDTPGVDPLNAETLAVHERFVAGGIVWLENLDLSGVAPGIYDFIALPLRIVGGCGSPVRAVLVEK
jgi:arylformamidase